MLHPIFTLLIRKPQLVVQHVAGYGALLQQEASTFATGMAVRVAAWVVLGIAALVFVLLAGVAVMLGAVQQSFHWALVVVPGVPLLVVLVAFVLAKRPLPPNAFKEVKAQVDADLQALHIAGEPR